MRPCERSSRARAVEKAIEASGLRWGPVGIDLSGGAKARAAGKSGLYLVEDNSRQ
jgi:hypothetical protein